jgi:hypothetical protein
MGRRVSGALTKGVLNTITNNAYNRFVLHTMMQAPVLSEKKLLPELDVIGSRFRFSLTADIRPQTPVARCQLSKTVLRYCDNALLLKAQTDDRR